MRPVIQVACQRYDPSVDASSIGGTFNVLSANRFPATPRFTLVYFMQLDAEDIGRILRYGIRVVSPDGGFKDFWEEDSHVIDEAEAGRPEWFRPSFEVSSLAFPTPGMYEFRLLVDGQEEAVAEVEFVLAGPSARPGP